MASGPSAEGQAILDMQADLKLKFNLHEDIIRSTWLSLDQENREEVILRAYVAGKDSIPLSRDDKRPGFKKFQLLLPEWNLHDLTMDGNYFLNLVAHRVTNGIGGCLEEDLNFIRLQMRTQGLRHPNAESVGAIMFCTEEWYGSSFRISESGDEGTLQTFNDCLDYGVAIPQDEGYLVLDRQQYLLPGLSVLLDDIMEKKRELDNPGVGNRIPKRKTVSSKNLQVQNTSAKSTKSGKSHKTMTVEQLAALAAAQLLSTEDHIELLYSEPLYLAHIANQFLFSFPEWVEDEKGNTMNTYTSHHSTIAVWDLFQEAHRAMAHWKILAALTSQLSHQASRTIDQQSLISEMWGVAMLELRRNRALLRKFVQVEPEYDEYYVRIAGDDDKVGKVKLRMPLQAIEKKSPMAAWMTQLASLNDLSVQEVHEILGKLEQFLEAVPAAREKISGSIEEILSDLAVSAEFAATLKSVSTNLQSASSSCVLGGRMQKLGETMDQMKEDCSLREFAFPVQKLKDHDNMTACLEALRRYIMKDSPNANGSDLGDLYLAAVQGALSELENKNPTSSNTAQDAFDPTPILNSLPDKPSQFPTDTTPTKIKTKSRSNSQVTEQPTPSTAANVPQGEEKQTLPPIPVDRKSFQTLNRLFNPTSVERTTGIPWSTFISAMTSGLGFGVFPVRGSVFRFQPPEKEYAYGWLPINIHQPHGKGAKLEGMELLKAVRRLKNRYGLGMERFVVK